MNILTIDVSLGGFSRWSYVHMKKSSVCSRGSVFWRSVLWRCAGNLDAGIIRSHVLVHSSFQKLLLIGAQVVA